MIIMIEIVETTELEKIHKASGETLKLKENDKSRKNKKDTMIDKEVRDKDKQKGSGEKNKGSEKNREKDNKKNKEKT